MGQSNDPPGLGGPGLLALGEGGLLAESQGRNIWQLALICGGVLVCALMVYSGINKMRDSSWRLQQIEQINHELDRENKVLHSQVQRLRDDKRAIDRAVRREMDMVRPDEVVYQFDAAANHKEAAR